MKADPKGIQLYFLKECTNKVTTLVSYKEKPKGCLRPNQRWALFLKKNPLEEPSDPASSSTHPLPEHPVSWCQFSEAGKRDNSSHAELPALVTLVPGMKDRKP